jgi:hypothetical protein
LRFINADLKGNFMAQLVAFLPPVPRLLVKILALTFKKGSSWHLKWSGGAVVAWLSKYHIFCK